MDFELEGDVLVARIPLHRGRPSDSGKNLVCASSGGFMEIPGTEYKINLNVIKRR
jgi:hypothetical protein